MPCLIKSSHVEATFDLPMTINKQNKYIFLESNPAKSDSGLNQSQTVMFREKAKNKLEEGRPCQTPVGLWLRPINIKLNIFLHLENPRMSQQYQPKQVTMKIKYILDKLLHIISCLTYSQCPLSTWKKCGSL